MKSVAGIDVSKQTLDVHAVGVWKQFTNDASGISKVRAFLARCKVQLVVMEATGSYHESLAVALHEAGFEVVVANPARTHYFAKSLGKRLKTDKVDAQVLAQFGVSQGEALERFTPPPLAVRQFRSLVRMRHDLITTCASAKGRLKGVNLEALEVKLLTAQVAFFKAQIQELDAQIRELLARTDSLGGAEKLLLTIPGVGPITAWTLISELGDLHRFESAKQVAAFAGVCPSFQHSGTSATGTGRMSRVGNRTVRKLLYLAALAAVKADGVFKDQFLHMTHRGKPKMIAVVAVMHKILRVAYGVVKSGCPFMKERALTPV